MPRHKNPAKTPVPAQMLQHVPKELSYIRRVAIKMLKIIDKEMSGKGAPIKDKQQYDKYFGSKASLADILVTLADLILRLTPVQGQTTPENQPLPLNDQDQLLVDTFLARRKPDQHTPNN
jgi:hypothetical protein